MEMAAKTKTNTEEEETFYSNNQQKLSFRTTVTHCGVPFDVFKSALQKCCRRGETENISWFIQEIVALKILSDPSDKVAMKRNMTNIANRLRVIAIEDVSPRCVLDVANVDYCLSEWENSNRNDFKYLAMACWILCKAKKLRVCSHLRMICHPNYAHANVTDEFWDQLSLTHVQGCINDNDRKNTIFILGLYYRKLLGLDRNFDIVDGDNSYKGKISTKANKKKLFSSFWEYLKLLCPSNFPHVSRNILFKKNFFESKDYFREEFLCLISAVEAIAAISLGFYLPPVEIPSSLGLEDDWHKIHKPTPIFGPHVYDRHVRNGNKSIEFFLNEGALVKNLDSEWSLKEMEDLYREIRLSKEKSPQSHHINNNKNVSNVQQRKRKREQTTKDTKRRKKTQRPLSLAFVKETICGNNFLDLLDYNIVKICTPKSRKGIVLIMKKRDDDDDSTCFVVKHMKKCINFGVDQLACHDIKHRNLLELPFLHVPNDMAANLYWSDVSYSREKQTFQKKDNDKNIYMVMGCVGNVSQTVRFTHNKTFAVDLMKKDINAFQSIISIIIFRSILGVTDTNFSNILIDDTRVYSVDENSIGTYSCEEILNFGPVRRIIEKIKEIYHSRSMTEAFPLWFDSKFIEDKHRIMKRVVECLRHYNIPEDKIQVVEKNFRDIIPCLEKNL